MATSTLLGTGRIPGDAHAAATFSRGSSASRLDHFVMDKAIISTALTSEVVLHRHDSDHKPLTLAFPCPPAAATACLVSSLPHVPSVPVPILSWDGAKKGKYVQQMKGCHAALEECHSKVHADQLDSAFQQLGDIMVEAASEAGCKRSSGSRAAKGSRGQAIF